MKNSNAEIAALVIVLLMGGAGVYHNEHVQKRTSQVKSKFLT